MRLNGTRFPISRVLLHLDGRNSFDRSKMDKRGEMDFFSLATKIEKIFPTSRLLPVTFYYSFKWIRERLMPIFQRGM